MAIKNKIAPRKEKAVEKIVKLLEEYPIIGLLNMENLPAAQLSDMRASLRDKVVMTMTKKRLMKLAFEKAKDKKEGIEELEKHFTGMPALLFTKENPFTLFKTLKKSKSSAPAKGGQTSPKDITIKAGPTPFAPGPIIGELGQLGIKAGIEKGKVAIKADKVAVRRGDVFSDKMAGILTRLGIQPMEIGLDLVAVYEDRSVFTREILDIDEEQTLATLQQLAQEAINVSMFTGYPTEETVRMLITKTFNDAKALALSKDILTSETVKDIIIKAERSASKIQKLTA